MTGTVSIEKDQILRTLKTLVAFDPKGSPYTGVQIKDDGSPQFYRSSHHGYIQSRDWDSTEITTHVSLSNFMDCLKNMPEDLIQLKVDTNNTLQICGTSNEVFESIAHVHTVTEGQAGLKTHDTGDCRFEVDKDVFSKISVVPFKIITPPILAKGRLMLVTDAGATVLWDGPEPMQKIPELYPRESFLRMVSNGAEVKELKITSNGYWGALLGNTLVYIKGHVIGRQLFDNHMAPGQALAKLPAQRLVAGLDAAVGLLGAAERVDVDPKLGVLAKGKFGDNRNSLGAAGSWPRFGVIAKTAKIISKALSQTLEDEVTLYSVPSQLPGVTVLRLRRGPFEVNFRSFV